MRQLTIQRTMQIVMFAMLFTLALRIPVDTDTWWHIRSGEYTLNEGFIYEDPFSHTMFGEDWINHSWGAQIILYFVYEILGDVGLALYTALLATAGMAVLNQICAGNIYLRAFALALGAATAAVFWTPRPQMISFFFSTVVLYLLYDYKINGRDRLWFIPPLMLLWVNMHAGFSIGYIFIGGVWVGEFVANIVQKGKSGLIPPQGLRKLMIVTLVSVAVLLINPYGFRMLLVPFETVSIGALRDFIQEWNSPNFQERQTWPFIIMWIALLGSIGASRKTLGWTDFILISGTTFMALTAGRNIAVFAVVATPILTFYSNAALEERGWVIKPMRYATKQQARLNLGIIVLILGGVLINAVSILSPATVDAAQREHLPVQLAEYIEMEQPPGPMLNSYNWGGYLMFALPDYLVYTDGRTDLYGDEFLTRYIQTIIGANDWLAVLEEDGINMVAIEEGSGLARNLAEEPGWSQVYPNDDYPDEGRVIFVRENEVNDAD